MYCAVNCITEPVHTCIRSNINSIIKSFRIKKTITQISKLVIFKLKKIHCRWCAALRVWAPSPPWSPVVCSSAFAFAPSVRTACEAALRCVVSHSRKLFSCGKLL